MANLGNFDASQVEPAVGFDPLPAGQYLAIITENEMNDTKARDGKYLELTFEVVDGQDKGRKLWARLNLQNKSKTAAKIARGELSAICRAVNVLRPADSAQIHNLSLSISVRCKKRPDTGEITKYEAKDAILGVPQQATDNTPPWQRTPAPSEVPF